MNSVTIDTTSTYRLKSSAVDPKDGQLTINAGKNAIVTVIAPLNYLINGQTQAVIRNSQFITLQLNQPKNQFNIIAGNPLATVPLQTNTIPYANVTGAPKFYFSVVPVNLIVGNNLITHGMNAKARILSCTQNGLWIGSTFNNNTSDPLNIVDIPVVGKPLNNVEIFIIGY